MKDFQGKKKEQPIVKINHEILCMPCFMKLEIVISTQKKLPKWKLCAETGAFSGENNCEPFEKSDFRK